MQDDLFGHVVDVSPSCFSATYCSGGSSYWDAVGIFQAGFSLGVVATEVPDTTINLLRLHAEKGGKSFIDSGAFGAFRAGRNVDFEAILTIYESILQSMSEEGRRNIAIVMPDVIGKQAESMNLWRHYQERIAQFVSSGADCIIPIHRGPMSVHDVGELLVEMFGSNIRLGIPSNAAALGDEEIARLRHGRFHILGKASLDVKMRRRAYTLLEANPGCDISCDANLIRARLGEVTEKHQALIAEVDDPFRAVFDETDLLFDVLHASGWLKRKEIALIAGIYGVKDSLSIARWVKAHRSAEGLASLVEAEDPEATLLFHLLPSVFDADAQRELSARLRAAAVTSSLLAA